ncbi:MAG TPA: Fic family protein [Solirubrobacteraceae bacterium]|jgi:Fic family protein
MRSFIDLDKTFAGQPRELGPVLARIDTGRGREQLFLDQVPQVLRELSEHARIASITASNAIEGVIVDSERAIKIAEGAPRFRNRNEKEFAGYRDAIDGLMRLGDYEPPSVSFLLHLHRQLFQHAGGRGGYLKTDPNYIVSYESGHREVVFQPPPPIDTEFLLRETFDRYDSAKRNEVGHPLVLIGALILDVLAIHPVADGNGRLARLLTSYELIAQGYGVARYVSLEQRIYDSKNTYYQRLYDSQQGWHAGEHTIWPWVSYLASILSVAYDDFEASVAAVRNAAGSKQARVREYILEQAPLEFRRRDIERAMPGVSLATIRLVLNELRDESRISVVGGGPGARWRRS